MSEEDPPVPVTEIHVGATGLTVDFNDVAHYANQLTPAEIAYHNTLGRGL